MLFRLVFAVLLAFTQARHFAMRERQAPAPFIIGGQDVSPVESGHSWLPYGYIFNFMCIHICFVVALIFCLFKIYDLEHQQLLWEGMGWGVGGGGVLMSDFLNSILENYNKLSASNVKIYFQNNSPFGSHFCGASLVSTTQFVTASHCVDGQSP